MDDDTDDDDDDMDDDARASPGIDRRASRKRFFVCALLLCVKRCVSRASMCAHQRNAFFRRVRGRGTAILDARLKGVDDVY